MKTPEFVRAAVLGVGAGMLVVSWSMASGPVGTLAAVGLVLLLLATR